MSDDENVAGFLMVLFLGALGVVVFLFRIVFQIALFLVILGGTAWLALWGLGKLLGA